MKRLSAGMVWVLVVLLLGVGVLVVARYQRQATGADVNDYESCAAKYPTLTSFPSQCVTPDGRTFTEATPIPTATAQ